MRYTIASSRRWFAPASLVCLVTTAAVPWPIAIAAPPPWRLPAEQTHLRPLDPAQLAPARIPAAGAPRTVMSADASVTEVPVRLNEIIREALERAEVIRVLGGVTAVSSGRTIYDPAIANTAIDAQQGAFDPTIGVRQDFLQTERPQAILDPTAAAGVSIDGTQIEQHQTSVNLSQRNLWGGQASARWQNVHTDPNLPLAVLDPFDDRAWELSYVQPLLAGAGWSANRVPIVVARINTQRSYFQFKDGLQELVASAVTGYWNLMTAQVDLWARQQQVNRAQETVKYFRAQTLVGRTALADVAQAEAALAGFEAGLVAAQANLLDTDAALRNLLALPPDGQSLFVPVTAPLRQHVTFNWDELLSVAEQQRPDIIELKLVLAADQQLLRQADNLALPQLDAIALNRWNGLEGEIPAGPRVANRPGQFADWQLAVNFSVPLGLRTARANLRQQELILARDRANLDQGVHQMVHQLALNVRRVDQLFAQYQATQRARVASRLNLEQQWEVVQKQRSAIYLNFLQALESWGNNVSAEASALAQYNIALAELERSSGTILESHGVRLVEEQYGSISPWGRHAPLRCYPRALHPSSPADRYSNDETNFTDFFELRSPSDDAPATNPVKSIGTGALSADSLPASPYGIPLEGPTTPANRPNGTYPEGSAGPASESLPSPPSAPLPTRLPPVE